MLRSLADLYLAYRQAKGALYFEHRGIGLLDLAYYESDLDSNLRKLQACLAENGGWFTGLPLGEVWVAPKRLRCAPRSNKEIVRIGGRSAAKGSVTLDVQLRLTPTIEFAIVEVLYLWEFGPALESVLSTSVVGYRLDSRKGELLKSRRWLFEYWPKRYQEFRTTPIEAAIRALRHHKEPVEILSADLASFYDTIDAGFLVDDEFVSNCHEASGDLDTDAFLTATQSLLESHHQYRINAARRTGLEWSIGIPIGALTSRVVANLALASLDHFVENLKYTICYRRYVDDIVVVYFPAVDASDALTDSITAVFPVVDSTSESIALDVCALKRPKCQLKIQKEKTRAHRLSGVQGTGFLQSIRDDFCQLVSERRAFLDTSLFLEDKALKLVSACKVDSSPLRVLRDADRLHLKHFALSTTLASLERASSLLDPNAAIAIAQQTQDHIGRVLDGEEDWVENFDLSIRLLRLSLATQDWKSFDQLNTRMDQTWGSVETLRKTVTTLSHSGRSINSDSAWIWLRNYLHEKRVEAIASSLPRTAPKRSAQGLNAGILVRTSRLGTLALFRCALRLAASDLRARDREDDKIGANPFDSVDHNWLKLSLVDDPALCSRLNTIESFVTECSQLGDKPWAIAPARLFLCTRPPSYLDIARRLLYHVEKNGFPSDGFDKLLQVVNAVRGTKYRDPLGEVIDDATVSFPCNEKITGLPSDPQLIIGNLFVPEKPYWYGAATRVEGSETGRPVLDWPRLRGLATVVAKATSIAKAPGRGRARPSLLVLPELSVPRSWFRTLANYIVRFGGIGLVVGLEYRHHATRPLVYNQVFAVIPGPFSSAATWPWTKRLPARDEADALLKRTPPLRFPTPPTLPRPRVVVHSTYGTFSVLICSELIEARRVADLLGRVELVLSPSWNQDTFSYDHLIQSVGLQLHCIVGIANNGKYSDCRVWAPKEKRYLRDLCRLIERGTDDVVSVILPIAELRRIHLGRLQDGDKKWRPPPPDWPS